jgi:hypothetical protein
MLDDTAALHRRSAPSRESLETVALVRQIRLVIECSGRKGDGSPFVIGSDVVARSTKSYVG